MSVKEKKKAQILKEDYLIGGKFPFLLKGMEIDSQDELHLKKWGLPEPSIIDPSLDYEDQTPLSPSTSDSLNLDPARIKKVFDKFSNFEKQLHEFIQGFLKSISTISSDRIQNIADDEEFLSLLHTAEQLPKMKDDFLLYFNIYQERTPENMSAYNFGLVSLLGLELQVSQQDLKHMLLAVIISKIFFFKQSFDKIKLMFVKHQNNSFNPSILKQQTTYILKLIHPFDLDKQIKYLLIYQNAPLDDIGQLELEKSKVSVTANILGLVKYHVWHHHLFYTSLFDLPAYSNLTLIKKKDKFFNNVLSAFLTQIGIFEAGSLVLLQKSNEIQCGIVIHGNGIHRPTVKIILNQNKEIDYSKVLIDFSLEENKDWKIFPINNRNQAKKLNTIFKENIFREKYTL